MTGVQTCALPISKVALTHKLQKRYHGVSFNNPPVNITPPEKNWDEARKNKTPHPRFEKEKSEKTGPRAERENSRGFDMFFADLRC